ncbi:hypothetical protein C7974DRAFT_183767 [Boeremia exigua]|uniref:uncharacterized protein n=1 Tax=Boeremia exigua TaxID=749465 RepID=UPI001E8CDFDD|nr:uncharacterized protein C7974DRAFT_183767 [Boeremia exigua]KAH6629248.1 hypothetical protein C7974DRAFT_183767 [Boeremia exigua]
MTAGTILHQHPQSHLSSFLDGTWPHTIEPVTACAPPTSRTHPHTSTNNPEPDGDIPSTIPFRIETTYACIEANCNKKYSRKPDLVRHYRGAHLHDQRYKCRIAACERSQRGFPRRDKRDDHERKVHKRKV